MQDQMSVQKSRHTPARVSTRVPVQGARVYRHVGTLVFYVCMQLHVSPCMCSPEINFLQMYIRMCMNVAMHMSVHMSARMSAHTSVRISVHMPVCMPMRMAGACPQSPYTYLNESHIHLHTLCSGV